jgi:hypothetical protein
MGTYRGGAGTALGKTAWVQAGGAKGDEQPERHGDAWEHATRANMYM